MAWPHQPHGRSKPSRCSSSTESGREDLQTFQWAGVIVQNALATVFARVLQDGRNVLAVQTLTQRRPKVVLKQTPVVRNHTKQFIEWPLAEPLLHSAFFAPEHVLHLSYMLQSDSCHMSLEVSRPLTIRSTSYFHCNGTQRRFRSRPSAR